MFLFILLIYVLSYIVTYYYCRFITKLTGTGWDWEDAAICIKFSFLSVIGIVIYTIIVVSQVIEDMPKKEGNKKIPWWL